MNTKTSSTNNIRLPEFEQPSFGGRLAERTVSLTLISLVLLAIFTVLVLMNVRIESAVEASGTLDKIPAAEADALPQWKVLLLVPERDINRIRKGATVKVFVPAAIEGGTWDGQGLPATVVAIGNELAEGSQPGQGLYLVEASFSVQGISAQQRALFRRGMTAEGHVITRSGLAIDLLKLYFEREFDFDAQ